jgi:chemotaxis signal transduction protein
VTSSKPDFAGDERLLTFEVGSTVYALPIAAVHEVAEAKQVACVPGLSVTEAGVMNWSGEALPIVANRLLLRASEADREEPQPECVPGHPGIVGEHVLVVAERAEAPARLGLPVDRVVGLVDGGPRLARGQRLVQERRPIEGRVVHVLDPRELVARAGRIVAKVEGAAA